MLSLIGTHTFHVIPFKCINLHWKLTENYKQKVELTSNLGKTFLKDI